MTFSLLVVLIGGDFVYDDEDNLSLQEVWSEHGCTRICSAGKS